MAPHKALIEAFQEFGRLAGNGEQKLEKLTDLFNKTRVAEMAASITDEEYVELCRKHNRPDLLPTRLREEGEQRAKEEPHAGA